MGVYMDRPPTCYMLCGGEVKTRPPPRQTVHVEAVLLSLPLKFHPSAQSRPKGFNNKSRNSENIDRSALPESELEYSSEGTEVVKW